MFVLFPLRLLAFLTIFCICLKSSSLKSNNEEAKYRKDHLFFRNVILPYLYLVVFFCKGGGGGERVAQLVERTTPGVEVLGSISAVAARFLLVGSMSV